LLRSGDHKQLRPLVEHELSVDSGRGLNFDLSIFERLQQQRHPVATLTTQRRMHPRISALIRTTLYPSLRARRFMKISTFAQGGRRWRPGPCLAEDTLCFKCRRHM